MPADTAQSDVKPFVAQDLIGPFRSKRLVIALVLIVLALLPGAAGALVREQMLDAYFAVSCFVAATLLAFYGIEKLLKINLAEKMSDAKALQVPFAAFLGMIPGCGGAVVVVAAYSSGHVGFGAVVAALTATMGDAAFLLIATRPDAALVVLPLSLVVGILSGWVVDRVNKMEFPADPSKSSVNAPSLGGTALRHWAFAAFALPGLVVGVLDLANMDIEAIFGANTLLALGLGGTFVGLLVWCMSPVKAMTNQGDPAVTRMAEETAFIAVWVLAAFLIFEFLVSFGGLDLKTWFAVVAPIVPLIAVVIGFIPGCGPQILVTTFYLNGFVPFSALVGNAISNDGDALFPAIALNPKAAIWATAYSAVPALIVSYGFFFLAPGFLN